MLKKVAKKSGQRSAKPEDVEMGKKIRLCRINARVSQAELGQKLGVSFQQVQKYEKGVNRVGASRIQDIAKHLGVPVSTFLASDEPLSKSLSEMVDAMGLRDVQQLVAAYLRLPDDVRPEIRKLVEKLADKLGD